MICGHQGCSFDGGSKAAQDREWVLAAAATLEQRGEGKIWAEIISTWVLLQRKWEKNEVRSFYTDHDCVPGRLTAGVGLSKR